MELTPEEKEAKAKLRIEALERELGSSDDFIYEKISALTKSLHFLFSSKDGCYE